MSKKLQPNPLPALASVIENLREYVITVDHLPDRNLSPNSRVHWAVKARSVRAQREEAGWLAKAEWGNQKPMLRARISYEFKVTNKRQRDIDNLVSACKSFQDGLVDGGVLSSDDSEHLEVGYSILSQGEAEQTIIKIEEIIG